MSLGFVKIANPAQIVGRTPPGPRGSPWTRFSSTESASSALDKPTRASAADQGVRPTINADCPILTKPSGIGLNACPTDLCNMPIALVGQAVRLPVSLYQGFFRIARGPARGAPEG